MFRYERPQKGRYRQFHQVGVEAYGLEGPEADAEVIAMSARLWKQLGIDNVELQINTLGTPESRARYRDMLVGYLEQHRDQLDEDSQRRLTTNPLRILDSKNPAMIGLLEGAPDIRDSLDADSLAHFEGVLALLRAAGLFPVVTPRLVRGLDYYTRTVFEWVTTELGAQGTICAGGRYDGLVEQIGGKPTPAVGFAFGMERVIGLLEQRQTLEPDGIDAYMVVLGDAAMGVAYRLAESIRDALPSAQLVVNAGGGSAKSQFKKADRSHARLALVLGESELENGTVTVKYLRANKPQVTLPQAELTTLLKNLD